MPSAKASRRKPANLSTSCAASGSTAISGTGRVEIEGAGDQKVEPGLVRLARRGGQIGARLVALAEAPLGADPVPAPRGLAVEDDPVALVGLVEAGGFQVLDDDLREIDLRRAGLR
jgi:hypothetical protein